jgi:hypothetical protein
MIFFMSDHSISNNSPHERRKQDRPWRSEPQAKSNQDQPVCKVNGVTAKAEWASLAKTGGSGIWVYRGSMAIHLPNSPEHQAKPSTNE